MNFRAMAKNILKRIFEAGRRNSSVDQARIQEAHDHMVGLGAQCQDSVKETKEALREAEALRVDDSFSSRTDALRKAAQALFQTDPYNGPYCYVRDCFDSDVVVQVGDAIYQIPYEMTPGGDGDDVELGDPIEVDIAYIPAQDPGEEEEETAGDEIVEARDIPQSVRKTYSKGDFAGKGTSFPIKVAGDVKDALASIGRAGKGNYSAARLKANILRIAKRKGFPIPKSDQEAVDSEKATTSPDGVTESTRVQLSGDYVQLREGAVAADGSAQIKIIQPGWGSSGYYSPELLKRDGPKVFGKGLQMFWDHQTDAEEAARPEGSLNNLAGELTGKAKYQEDGPTGPGLYAPIKVHNAYSDSVNDLSKSIGVSIRAAGRAKEGEAEGKKGPVIQSLESAKSIDFVTSPGAGGEILQLFEAARTRTKTTQESQMEAKDLKEANAQLTAQAGELAKLRETVLLREAADFVRESIPAATLPAVTRQRLINELVRAMPLKENALDTAAYKTKLDEAVKAAVAEIAAITGAGEVRGMGATPTADETKSLAEAEKTMIDSFALLGLSEAGAKIAAKGRVQ
jgi:hypothetical protein